MKFGIKLILSGILALILGVAFASPILFANLQLRERVKISVDVVYAYFAIQNFDADIIGLWRNLSEPIERDLWFVSYFVVLNVTNLSDKLAMIEKFQVMVAQKITMKRLPTNEIQVSAVNSIITDFLDGKQYPGWSHYWSPGESRLIGFTGMREVSNAAAYSQLETGIVYLFGEAEGQPIGGKMSKVFSLKHVQLQIIDKEFLYNKILSENQLLRIDSNGIDVYVETRR